MITLLLLAGEGASLTALAAGHADIWKVWIVANSLFLASAGLVTRLLDDFVVTLWRVMRRAGPPGRDSS